jgi:rhamnosyltransferase
MKLSIVIRAYNEEAHIERLMLGIAAQRLQPYEVILVDSGSTDSTAEIARAHGARIVPIKKAEFTFGRALNKGCAEARGDILVFASAHVYPVYDTWLEKLVAPFSEPQVVLSYGRQRGDGNSKFSEHQIFARWFPRTSEWPQRTYFCNNANCAIRRSAWEQQPYDEMVTGLEDLAWAKIAQARGGQLAYVAEAEIIHVHDETWRQIQNRYRREAIAMRSIVENARFTRIDFARLFFRTVLQDSRAAWRSSVLKKEFGSIARFRWNQLLGTYRGYNDPPEVSAQLRKRFYYPSRPRDPRYSHGDQEVHLIDYEALASKSKLRAVPEREHPAATQANDGQETGAVIHILRGDR